MGATRLRCAMIAGGFVWAAAMFSGCSGPSRSMTEEEWTRAYCAAGRRFNEAIEPYMTPGDEDVPRLLVEYRRAMAEHAAALRKLTPPSTVAPFHDYMVRLFEAGAAVDVSAITETDTGEATAAFMRTAAAVVTPPASPEPGVVDRLARIAAEIEECPPGLFVGGGGVGVR